MFALRSVERLLKTSFDQPLPDVFHRLDSARKRLGDLLVGPVGAVHICFQQNLGTPDLLAGPFQFFDNFAKLVPFLIREPNDILLLHGTPPCAIQHPQSSENRQPQSLAVTKH